MEVSEPVLATVLSSVIVSTLGVIANELWLKPYREYKKLKGEIVFALVYFANSYANPAKYKDSSDKEIAWRDDVSDQLRRLSSRLYETAESRSWYALGIPKKEILYQVAKQLMGMSNGLFAEDPCDDRNMKRVEHVKRMLKITV